MTEKERFPLLDRPLERAASTWFDAQRPAPPGDGTGRMSFGPLPETRGDCRPLDQEGAYVDHSIPR